jgi:hypothetical protein
VKDGEVHDTTLEQDGVRRNCLPDRDAALTELEDRVKGGRGSDVYGMAVCDSFHAIPPHGQD